MNAHSNRHDDPLVRIELDLQELRARFDTELPHLATRADVSDGVNRALRWIVGALAGCFVLFLALMSFQHQEVSSVKAELRGEIVAARTDLHAEIVATRTDLRQEMQGMRQEMDAMRKDMMRMNETLDRIDARQRDAERHAGRAH